MGSEALHEDAGDLSAETREMHRAIVSLIEELEAVDWYQQRVDASDDEALQAILAHNRDEEKEHACMTLEWIRRHDERFDAFLREFLFREGPIHDGSGASGDRSDASLGIGSLRTGPEEDAA